MSLSYNVLILHFLGSKKEWCFLCEFEKLIAEGKRGKSPLSPTGILSHLRDIGSSFGPGREEDAHEFLRRDFLFLIFLSYNAIPLMMDVSIQNLHISSDG